MIIIPAIDILDGQVVRLQQGDYAQKTVYSDDPIKQAHLFVKQGAEFLHVVDLNGACDGVMKNRDTIFEIARNSDVSIQVGGGIRSTEDIAALLDAGVSRVIISTAALNDMFFLKHVIEMFGADRIVVSVDVRDGSACMSGWTRSVAQSVEQVLISLKEAGLHYIVYTDISRDGMQMAPNFAATREAITYGFSVIASGGVSSKEDVEELRDMQVYGCIIGKKVYEDPLFLSKCLQSKK